MDAGAAGQQHVQPFDPPVPSYLRVCAAHLHEPSLPWLALSGRMTLNTHPSHTPVPSPRPLLNSHTPLHIHPCPHTHTPLPTQTHTHTSTHPPTHTHLYPHTPTYLPTDPLPGGGGTWVCRQRLHWCAAVPPCRAAQRRCPADGQAQPRGRQGVLYWQVCVCA